VTTTDTHRNYNSHMAFGTVEQGKKWVGRKTAPRRAIAPVSAHTGRLYAALLEDRNERYWDADVCPPGLLLSFDFRFPWHPDPAEDLRATSVVRDIPLPGRFVINVETDTEFLLPIKAGDHMTVAGEVLAVSDMKRTRIGVGNFVTTLSAYSRQDGECCARNTNVIFRYDPLDET
jgi:uncharacterized protein